jgi:hypothetical protein
VIDNSKLNKLSIDRAFTKARNMDATELNSLSLFKTPQQTAVDKLKATEIQEDFK